MAAADGVVDRDDAPTGAPSPGPGAPGQVDDRPVHVPAAELSRGRIAAAAVLLAVSSIAAVALLPPLTAAALLITGALIVLLRRIVLTWNAMIIGLAAVIMFVPARRYAIPSPLPFQLEPYRLGIAIVVVTLVVALLLKPEVRWRPIAFGWPIAFFLTAVAVSFVVNVVDLTNEALVATALGGIAQLLLMLSVFFCYRQLFRAERDVMLLLTFITWAGVVVAGFAVFERITRTNVFLMLGNFLPLTLLREGGDVSRAGVARAFGSAQHPIALAVALCMLIPIAVYLAKYAAWPRNEVNRRIVYAGAMVMLFGGVLAAISRTAVVVLAVMFLITLILHPRVAALLLAVALPVMLLAAAVLPKVFESMVLSFLDVDSLVASQYTSAGFRGAGRLADLGPALREVAQHPFFGIGYGSRIVIGDRRNAFILDNQFLGTLMETGVLGVIGLAVLLLVPPILLLRFAFLQAAEPRHANLAFMLAVALSGYVAAIFFYDAFGFFQTFFLWCMLAAAAAWVLTEAPRRAVAGAAVGGTGDDGVPAASAPAPGVAA